jgi:hypothetical protein
VPSYSKRLSYESSHDQRHTSQEPRLEDLPCPGLTVIPSPASSPSCCRDVRTPHPWIQTVPIVPEDPVLAGREVGGVVSPFLVTAVCLALLAATAQHHAGDLRRQGQLQVIWSAPPGKPVDADSDTLLAADGQGTSRSGGRSRRETGARDRRGAQRICLLACFPG